MMLLKQSTAVDIPMGPFVDNADGYTPETGLTITQPDIRLKKNGGAWAQKNAAQTLSHEENGWYEVALDTTDTATLGHLVVAIYESGALPVWREFMVVTANVYDSLVGGSDTLQVDVAQWLGTAPATPTVAGVPEVDVTHVAGSATTATLDTIKAETASILADTAEIGAAGSGLTEAGGTGDQFTAIPWNASWDAEVQSEVEDGLAAYDPPTKAELDAAVSGLSTLDAAGVRTAVGLASANLDTQLDALPTANENADALLDRSNGVETGWTVRQVWRLCSAVLLGKASVSSISAVFRDLNDSKDRVTATVDSVGSRSSVTKDAS